MSHRAVRWIIIASSIAIAALSAVDHAGSWNDASRLATIECLVDHGTWRIDESIFVDVVRAGGSDPNPFGEQAAAFPGGTLDKLKIGAHYYSDKSPTPALIMAGPYWLWRAIGGVSVAERPDLFCRAMSWLTSGLAFVITVVSFDVLAARWRFRPSARLLLAATLATGTMALPYSRSVNNHEILLAIMALLCLRIDHLEDTWHGVVAGGLAGIAYGVDLGAGPVIVICSTGFMVWHTVIASRRSNSFMPLAAFVVALAPGVLLHHFLNYQIGGTWRPANSNPEYLNWPGSPFNTANMSGQWSHASVVSFVAYAMDLLVGKKGFLGHNLPLLIGLIGCKKLLRRPHRRQVMVAWSLAVSIGIWLIYAIGSSNYSGACVSVRWYVPVIAPMWYVTLLALKEQPELMRPCGWLAGLSACVNVLAWRHGPWHAHVLCSYWPALVCAAIVLAAHATRTRQGKLVAPVEAKAA